MASLIAFLLLIGMGLSWQQAAAADSADGQDFAAWIEAVKQDAQLAGITPAATSALDHVIPDPRVIALDQRQPESSLSLTAYAAGVVTKSRVQKGRALIKKHRKILQEVAARYGVPPQMIVALWGMESGFGRNMGGYSVIDSLATLAYEGRRAAFFRGELLNALRILDQEHIPASDLRGSWAGAMGQCQFMPSTYLRYAVDTDQSGKRDIWHDTGDVFASIANYLAAEGWNRHQTWGREVRITRPVDPQIVGLGHQETLATWRAQGIRNKDGSPLPIKDLRASLIQPDGADGRSFLVYDNLGALRRWNRSTSFAVTAGLLADRIQ